MTANPHAHDTTNAHRRGLYGRKATRPMQLNNFFNTWECDALWELNGAHSVYIWEPLDVDAPADARPSCFMLNRVAFYDATGNTRLAEIQHHDLSHPTHLLLLDNGVFYEVASGRVIYRAGRWWMRWNGYKNTRRARMLNAGFPAFKE